jgi:hypothetical protein
MNRLAPVFLIASLVLSGCGRVFEQPPQPGVVLGTLLLSQEPDVPAPGARVRLVECGLSVSSDASGRFQFDEVPQGDFTLRIESGDYVQELQDVVVREGVRDLGTIELDRSGWVTGIVTVQGGGTALNTVVYIVGGDQLTHAAHDGSYSLGGVAPGLRGVGAARPGYMLSSPVEAEVLSGETTRENLALVPIPPGAVGQVTGMVILGNPGPEAGVLVSLNERFSSTQYTAVTDKNGRFEIPDVPAGYYEFIASHEGYRTVGLPNLEVRPDEELNLPTVVLPPGDSGTPSRPGDSDPNGNLDDDGDGRPDKSDNCPVIPNPSQEDYDADGVGDACETEVPPNDPDQDYVPSDRDNCPDAFNPYQENHDDDPLGDACDPDDDNDGIPDTADTCPFIADPNNNPGLCEWKSGLIYSGQDPQTGDIHLYMMKMKPEGGESSRLTAAPGQAWGASVVRDALGTWVYFHHRDSDQDHFKICRIDLDQAMAQPVANLQGRCYDWGSDAMNPVVCRDLVFYDWFMGDHWVVRVVNVNQLALGGTDLVFSPLLNTPRPIFSYRYAGCYDTGGVEFELAMNMDFNSASNTALDWDFWTMTFNPPDMALRPTVFLGDPGTHELRTSKGPSSGWFIERESGARSDIILYDWQTGRTDVVVDGAYNREPAYLIVDPELQTGLLAYQSDLHGSVDVYVRAYGSSGVVRVTRGEGWEGSPAWVPLP